MWSFGVLALSLKGLRMAGVMIVVVIGIVLGFVAMLVLLGRGDRANRSALRVTIWTRLKWKLFGMTQEEYAELEQERAKYHDLMKSDLMDMARQMGTSMTSEQAEEQLRLGAEKRAFYEEGRRRGLDRDEIDAHWRRLHR